MYGPLITSTLERGNFGRIISESKDTNDKIQAQWNHSYTYNNDLLSGSYSESPHATQHNIAFQHIKVQMHTSGTICIWHLPSTFFADVLEENIKMWGIIHVHKFLINMWEYNLWECNLWQRVPSQLKVQYCKIT